ncbi:hypothetical protein GC163_01045 [bacterium]|nr:hypothetical protein [bacterium]
MSKRTTFTCIVLACASSAAAQECAAPGPVCHTPCVPQTAAAAAAPANDQGRFVRAPAAGATAGESNTLGLRGPAIHIPEMRIALPSIEFPSPYKIRHDAFKVFDQIRSPLVQDAAIEFDNVAPSAAPAPAAAPATTQPAYVPYCPPACAAPVQCTEMEQTLKALQSQLARLESLERELQEIKQQHQTAQPTTVAASRPARSASAAPPPSRPLPKLRQPIYETASYEEPVAVSTTPAKKPRPTTTMAPREMGLSSPGRSGEFGEWSQK